MKNKKLKNLNYNSDDMKEIKTLVIITIVIVILAVGLYFLTEGALNKKNNEGETPEGIISYRETLIGAMFDKLETEYYVFAYSSKDENAGQYDALLANYEGKEDAKKIYYIDLALKFNSGVLSDKANTKPTNVAEVAIKDVALILIKNGKVNKYYETITDLEKVLN